MRKIILFISFVWCLTMYSQNSEIDRIHFEYNRGGAYVGPNYRIRFGMMSGDPSKKYIDVFGEIDEKKEIRAQISFEKYDAICKRLLKLKPKDIIKDAPFYMDATDTELSFSVFNNTVTYTVSGLSNGDESTSRKDFLEVIKMLLEAVEIKIPFIN